MRWEPLLLIVLAAMLSGLFILLTITNRRHRWLALLTLAYLTGLSAIVFTPISFDGTALYIMPVGTGRVNLTQLSIFNLGFVENIVLTLPLGLLVKWLWPRLSLMDAGLFGLFVGGGIETTQFVLSHHWLINRSSDINDVLANATGILVGAILVGSYNRFLRRRSVVASQKPVNA